MTDPTEPIFPVIGDILKRVFGRYRFPYHVQSRLLEEADDTEYNFKNAAMFAFGGIGPDGREIKFGGTAGWGPMVIYEAGELATGSDGWVYRAVGQTRGMDPTANDGRDWLPVETINPATQLLKWSAARARVRTASGRARIVCLGDSTTAGFGAAGNGYTSAKAFSYPRRLASQLTALGIPAQETSVMGVNQELVSVAAFETRITLGGGWAKSSFPTIGRRGFECTANAATLAFAVTESCDAADVYFANFNGNGGFTINIDGGSTLATVSPSGGGNIAKQTVAFASGAHTLNIVTNSTSFAYVAGIVMYSTSSPKVEIINAGFDAARVSDVNASDQYYSAKTAALVLAPDLYIVNIGINDSIYTDPDDYFDSLASLIGGLQAVADVMIIVPQPIGVETPSLSGITAAQRAVASASNAPLVDLFARWVSFSAANAVGLPYDTLHPSKIGYDDAARAIAAVLTQ